MLWQGVGGAWAGCGVGKSVEEGCLTGSIPSYMSLAAGSEPCSEVISPAGVKGYQRRLIDGAHDAGAVCRYPGCSSFLKQRLQHRRLIRPSFTSPLLSASSPSSCSLYARVWAMVSEGLRSSLPACLHGQCRGGRGVQGVWCPRRQPGQLDLVPSVLHLSNMNLRGF